MNNYNLLWEHSYMRTNAGCLLRIQDVHMTCNIEFMGMPHIVCLCPWACKLPCVQQ